MQSKKSKPNHRFMDGACNATLPYTKWKLRNSTTYQVVVSQFVEWWICKIFTQIETEIGVRYSL